MPTAAYATQFTAAVRLVSRVKTGTVGPQVVADDFLENPFRTPGVRKKQSHAAYVERNSTISP